MIRWKHHSPAPMMATVLLLATLSAARAEAVEIRIEPSHPLPEQPFRIVVDGRQDHRCVPELTAVESLPDRIRITATQAHDRGQNQSKCTKADTAWAINISSSQLKTDGSAPQPGVMPVEFVVVETVGNVAVGRIKAFELLAIGGLDVTPETGLWWAEPGGLHDSSGPGIGFSLELQGGQLVMMSNLYDQEGAPYWLFSSAVMSAGVARAPLLSLYGGQALFSDYVPPEAALGSGQVLLHFDSPATATAWFVAPASDDSDADLMVQPVSLVRYAFGLGNAEQQLAGAWLLLEGQEPVTRRIELLPGPATEQQLVFDEYAEGDLNHRPGSVCCSQPTANCWRNWTASV
jgi:hypothetical protein